MKVDSRVLQSIPAAADGPLATQAPPKPVDDAARRALAQARDALAVRSDLSATRKAQAREKVEALKKQLADLALVAAVNPKAMARMLNNLAKQLAVASAQYADAGDPKDLQRLAASVEEQARAIEAGGGGLPVAKDEKTSAIQDALAAATASDADKRFVRDVQTLRKRIQNLFEAAVRRAEKDGEGNEKDVREIKDLIADFSANDGVIAEAAETITGWWGPHQVDLAV